MPWVHNKSTYIETDILKIIELEGGWFLTNYLQQVVKSYEEHRTPEVPPLYTSVEEMMPLIEELEALRGISDNDRQASQKRKRKQALLKELRPKVQQWGVYMVLLIEEKKIHEFRTGFPFLWMHDLRRPTSVISFQVERNAKTGTTTMSCGKKTALQLFFYWQASEDNQNWFTIERTSLPSLTTKKLDPNKRYFFRMFMKNPKGKWEMHLLGWGRGKHFEGENLHLP